MKCLWFLSVLTMSLWEESVSETKTLNSVQRRGPPEGVQFLQRIRRSWVWNQFFVPEEYTGDEPLYVGKV